jgi:hypothetical protein
MKNASRRGKRKLQNEIQAKFGAGSDLNSELRATTKKRDGEIYRLGFTTKRYGFILNKGTKGDVVRHTRSRYGKGDNKWEVSAHNRRPIQAKPWIQDAMDVVVPEIANTVAKIKGDDMIKTVDKLSVGFMGKSKFRT